MEAQKTISTSSNNDTSSFWTSPLHQKLLNSTQRTIGLQNDIVGLSKDIEKGVRMNLAVVLLEQQHKTTSDLEAVSKARSMAVSIHNTEMQKVMRVWADIKEARYSTAAQVYAQSLVAFTRTHFSWAAHAHRYQSKHMSLLEMLSSVAQSTAVEGLRFKARVLRTRQSMGRLPISHGMR